MKFIVDKIPKCGSECYFRQAGTKNIPDSDIKGERIIRGCYYCQLHIKKDCIDSGTWIPKKYECEVDKGKPCKYLRAI